MYNSLELIVFAADIGGTNSRFALFAAKDTAGEDAARTAPRLLAELWLPTNAASSFSELLRQARAALWTDAKHLPEPDILSLGVPGPVYGHAPDELCAPPNIAWRISSEEARQSNAFNSAHIFLCNDFMALGHACLYPATLNLQEILPGVASNEHPLALIGAGTGLGKAIVLPENSGGLSVLPTEGGHGVFPFSGAAESAFAEYVRQKLQENEIIGDMVLSGKGLELLFAFHTGRELPANAISPLLPDHPKVTEWLARFYGRACRNFVLDTLALRGVFIGGGLVSYLPGLVSHPAFKESFRNSRSQAELLARLPVSLIRNTSAGLWGAVISGLLRASGL